MRKHSCKNRSAIASCGLLIADDVFLDNDRTESRKGVEQCQSRFRNL